MENPVLDPKVLQDKTNEYALKGAIKTIEEFYSGYNSPYVKSIKEALEKKQLGFNFELPDVVAKINDALVAEVDTIVNSTIALTYIPIVKKCLVRADATMKMSDLLREIINELDIESMSDIELSMDENISHGWYNIEISTAKKSYELTLHKGYDEKFNSTKEHYCFLSMPRYSDSGRTMKIQMDGCTVEMPFVTSILTDPIYRIIAGLLIAKTKIIIDTTELDEDMFPNHCHC